MITIRQSEGCHSVSARTGSATLVPGTLVKFAQGVASGEQPKCVVCTAADIIDVTVMKGIVDYIMPDSQAVDFTVDPATQLLTPVADTIPQDAQVNVWMGIVEIAYSEDMLPAALKSATAREADKVAFDGDTGLPAAYNSAGVDGTQAYAGVVYRVDGPEITMVINTTAFPVA